MPFLKKNLARFVVGGMFLLLAAQLTWWLTFFRLKQMRFEQLESDLDEQRIALAAELHRQFDGISCNDIAGTGRRKCFVQPEIAQERARRHVREMYMLVSETLFVLTVLGYGSWLVVRSVQREKKLAEERVTFLNSIAHELKTPIAGAQLALQTLQKRSLPEKQKKDLLASAIENLRRLTSQIENVLLSGEMDRIAPEAANQQSDAAAVARKYCDSLPEKDTIRIDSPHSISVRLPSHLLERLYDILIQNALLHARTYVTVSIRSESGGVSIRVIDNGRGIPESELENIFRPFYRLSEERGTGLGLYLARQITKIAGGSLSASNSPDGGAVFHVRLPSG